MLLGMTLLAAAAATPPPLLLTGGSVRVASSAPARNAAVLLVNGRVEFVGDEAEARRRAPAARVVPLSGASVLPGLADAHGHLHGLGLAEEALDVRGLGIEEIAANVRRRAAALPSGSWIEGRGWDQNLWPRAAFPTRAPLDAAAPKHPVALRRVDGHAVWANAAALRAAGIDPEAPAPADPAGGKILRDAKGRPTGVLVDNAADLVLNAVPQGDAATIERRLLAAMRRCARAGLTSVGDASSYGPAEVAVLRALARDGRLPIRVQATIGATPKDLALLAGPPIVEGRLTVGAVKVYADGALGSRGAALLAPYSDEPESTGLVLTDEKTLRELAARCFRAGWQPWIHAIGDRGNRIALDALEAALAAEKPKDARPRVEHAQVLSPADIGRFRSLGVVASVQPTHATSDAAWAAARLGPERVKGAYAYRSLLEAGARLAGGSDFPIESEEPLLGLWAAVARGPEGKPFLPEQRLTAAEALALFTDGAAYAEKAESRRGRIAPGFEGDVTVLDRDPLSVPAAEIPKLKVLMTIVGGEVVYRR